MRRFAKPSSRAPTAPVNYYAEYLESETFPSELATLALRDYIRRKFDGRRIDVVVADTTPALQFVIRFREELFPRVPIAFVAGRIPDAIAAAHRCRHHRSAERGRALGETLDLALRLHPSVKPCVRRRASARYRTATTHRIRAALGSFSERVALTLRQGGVGASPPCRR